MTSRLLADVREILLAQMVGADVQRIVAVAVRRAGDEKAIDSL